MIGFVAVNILYIHVYIKHITMATIWIFRISVSRICRKSFPCVFLLSCQCDGPSCVKIQTKRAVVAMIGATDERKMINNGQNDWACDVIRASFIYLFGFYLFIYLFNPEPFTFEWTDRFLPHLVLCKTRSATLCMPACVCVYMRLHVMSGTMKCVWCWVFF